jgi:ceramide glucosyltransferase
MRTLRVLRPRSFCFLFSSFSLLLAGSGMLLCLAEPTVSVAAWGLFWITVIARLLLYLMHRLPSERLTDLWLLPVRDLLMCGVWCGCFFTARVLWRGSAFDVDADGILR